MANVCGKGVAPRKLLVLAAIAGELAVLLTWWSWRHRAAVPTGLVQPMEPLQMEPVRLHLPCKLEGTTLVVEALAAYEGVFWEDGSGREVGDIAALVVRNRGSRHIVSARIILECSSRILQFRISELPPGGTVLALEAEGKPHQADTLVACSGWAIASDTDRFSPEVTVEEAAGGMVRVKSCGDRMLPRVKISYKTYDRESGQYIGGVAYSAELRLLFPGETRELYLPHYTPGYSRIVRIGTE